MADHSSSTVDNISLSKVLVNGCTATDGTAPRYTTASGGAVRSDQQARSLTLEPNQPQDVLQQAISELSQKSTTFLPAFLQQRDLVATAFGPFGFHNPLAFAGFSPILFANSGPMPVSVTGTDAAIDEGARKSNSVASDAYQRGTEDTIMSLVRAGGMADIAVPEQPVISGISVTNNSRIGQGEINNEEFLVCLGSNSLERRIQNIPYFDASTLTDPDPVVIANRRTRGGVTEPFPEKLYRMIREAEMDGKQYVLSFFPHGRSFAIHNPDRFCSEIMPKYFKQSRLSSFQRQLNLYGFTRINSGPDAGGYYHELFLKGRPALSIHILRVGVPQATPRRRGVKAHDSMKTPDFYSMPAITPNERSSVFLFRPALKG